MKISEDNPLCKCGCGKPAVRYNNPDGTFNCWRKYAAGHAAWQQNDVYAPTDAESLQYAAAVIDCEGCIFASVAYLKDGRQRFNLRVVVTMCSPGVVEWLQSKFGGLLTYSTPKSAIRKRVAWQLAGAKIKPFLSAIKPYLKEKGNQAEIALLLADTHGKDIPRNRVSLEIQKFRDECTKKLKAMKTDYLLPLQ